MNLYPLLDQRSVPARREHSSLQLDAQILEVFSNENVAYLARRGFDAADVMTWAWILTGRTAEQALLRLFTVVSCQFPRRSAQEAIPAFIFLFLLRRKHIPAKSLKLCLIHAWDRLGNRATGLSAITSDEKLDELLKLRPWHQTRWRPPEAHVRACSQMDEKSVMVMIIRLLRHARRVWTASLVSISKMISRHVNGSGAASDSVNAETLNGKKAARLTLFYNRALSLLSMPSSVNPFLSTPYHQRAQFHLIERMAEFNPPLPINKEGYRAVVRVQLAHRKTPRERQWAELKSKSWPPWKEEKTGLDAEKGIEHGISRAKEALTRMKEAGYAPGTWGKVVDIFAGWDTDGSPTIQTRTQLPKVPNKEEDIWAARIRSTRTANEAWACFLARCDDRLPPSEEIYHAMFEKIIYEEKRKRKGSMGEVRTSHHAAPDPETRYLPGDGKEVFPEPISPNEAIYVRSQLPSVSDLYDQMYRDGILPAGRFLELLISHAESIEVGLKYLSPWGNFGSEVFHSLMSSDLANKPGDSPANILLKGMPEHTFTAFIKLLCRFPLSRYPVTVTPYPDKPDSSPAAPSYRQSRLIGRPTRNSASSVGLAFRLMLLRRPKYRPPWNALLSALAQPKLALTGPDAAIIVGNLRYSHDTLPWELMVQLVNQMKSLDLVIDGQGFLTLCVGLERAISACLKARKPASPLIRCEAEGVLENTPNFLKSVFRDLVGADAGLGLERREPPSSSADPPDEADRYLQLPSLLVVPSPVQLHAYIRVLGILQDHEELLALMHWMAKFSPELDTVTDETSNGRKMLRRAIVAARVFLELSWKGKDVREDIEDGTAPGWTLHISREADAHIHEQVKAIVESVGSWGGWPRDDEVSSYCKRGRFPNIR
ncbi:hypothetical protein GP486_000235 [Trichoglossum hirsutum]|uniref:Uncharacterized protein n=1 Tax=Trichoglossum hirsutum TaxID=265104 RepID=A0A9P8LIX8_9PEZI|nr:hypothetical protein GP486_000235 [Trichoglossum hirsutum]